MIVFNLACEQDHAFEGWFASGEAFEQQKSRGLVACPICGNATIHKQLTAPRLNLGHAESSAPGSAGAADHNHEEVQAYLGSEQMLIKQFRQFIMNNTENVGAAFAETARKMHYGEETHRNIRGRVSREEADELREEGIDTMSLPGGIVMDEGVQ